MWDKETSKNKQLDETSVEGNTDNSASRYFKRNNAYENVSAGTDKVVVATYVVNDDDDFPDIRRNVTDRPRSLGTEQSNIDHLLSIVQLSDGPSTSSSLLKKDLPNKVPYSAKCSDLKSVLPTSTASISTAAKEKHNTDALTIAIDKDELPYKNTNITCQSSMQSNKPVNSVKFSPISKKPTQNEKVPEQRRKNIPSDNVAGPPIQSLYDKSLVMSVDDLQSATREYSPISVEGLTSMSEKRTCSPTPSSITSVSTLRVARSSSGRRMDCLRHMRRPPKEPEEYLDALFPHIRKSHNQIRQALLHAPLTDVKDNALLKKKMLELIQMYTSGCKDEFERVGPSLVLCRRLKRNIIRLLDLFHEICSSSREDHAYLYHISQLIAVYASLEIRLSFNLTRLQKCALIHRISHIINKHLMVKNESLAKENILRMFLHMPDMYSARFIMEPLFNTFLQEIPTSSNTWCQKELTDKVFVQYIIILHMWKEMLRDPLEQVDLINRAQHFMCPTKTLHANPMYANHLPTIHTRKHAVKDILNSLKFFHDLRNAAICDDTLPGGDDDIEVVIDEVINTPFWDFGATYTGESKQSRNLNRKVVIADPTECVDLTQEDDQQYSTDSSLEWLTKLKERAAERVQGDESEKVICLDSDSDGELFCGSILDPSESYQDCDAVDTDYTSLDGSTSDDKDLSEDEVLSGNGITPNGLRTYLAPRTKNQINITNEERSTTCPSEVSDPYQRTRDCDGEGDSALVGTKKSAVASVTSAEPTLPLILNSFTVSGKQNMHLLNSPRFSLDIGPERLGNEDIEFHDTCGDERELSLNLKLKKNQFKRAGNVMVNDHAAASPTSVGGYYDKEVNNDAEEEEDEYNSLPSTASSSTTLGKVIYTQALPRPSQHFSTESDQREDNYNRIDCTEKNAVDNEGSKEQGNKKQMLILGEDRPVKKQVKFNDNPIGPTRRPHTKLPIKPAIHLSKIQPNNQQPIFSNSPQPRFSSPSSSTSSTTESLKQMAKKGRNFVDIIKTYKSKKILKSSSTIIIDSDDDDIIYVNTSANNKTNLVSTQPIQSKNNYVKGITNEPLSICNSNICNKNRMCKMQACDVSNSNTMILEPKDISSTNNIRNKSVEIMHITEKEEGDNVDSIVTNNVGVLEVVKPVEREEQNSNVSTTTGPNVDTNTEDESNKVLESTCEEAGYRAHFLEIITSSDICTSTSTDTIVLSTDCSARNLVQFSSTTESAEVNEGMQLMADSNANKNLITAAAIADECMNITPELNESISLGNNENVSKDITCEHKRDLDDKYPRDVEATILEPNLDIQCTNKHAVESTQDKVGSKQQESNIEETLLSNKIHSEVVLALSENTFDNSNENVLDNNADSAVKHLSSSENINKEEICANSVIPEILTEISETCNDQSKVEEVQETSEVSKASLADSLHESQTSTLEVTDKSEVQITDIAENYIATKTNVTPASNTVTTEACLSKTQPLEEPTDHDTRDNTVDTVIITNTTTLSQDSENPIIEKIVKSIEQLGVEENANHELTESEIIEADNTTTVAHETNMELHNPTSSELYAAANNINIEESISQETAPAAQASDVKSPVVQMHFSALNECQINTTETEQNLYCNIDLENISNERNISESIREGLENVPKNSDAKISMNKTESIEVPTEIYNPAITKSDGLVCLVEAVKAVEALTFTKQIAEYTKPAEEDRNEQEKSDEKQTTCNVELEPNFNVSTDTLDTRKTNDNETGILNNTLENNLEKTDICILVKPKATESNDIYFGGDKSPKTNLERLAEAAVQKYGEHVADRETCTLAHIQTNPNNLALGPVDEKLCDMPKSQTDIIGNKDINKMSESEKSTIELNMTELQAAEHQTSCQEQSTIDNMQISQTIDYDMHIFDLGDNVKNIKDSVKFNTTTACDFEPEDVFKSSVITQENENADKISEIEKNNSSAVAAQPKTGSTFYSHFESFISTLKNTKESKCEVKGQRRSPRTQKLNATTEGSSFSENVSDIKSPRNNAVKNVLSKSNEDLVITNEVSNKSLAQDSPPLSTSSDSEFSNVSSVGVESRKRYSLRKSDQWKVVKNTSLRTSPSASSAECLDNIKSVHTTLNTKRCIKIRLARAKVPTKAEQKDQPSTEQTEPKSETQFVDVSHRPITRRLAAALNSSLQIATDNTVIEPIKPFARGKKCKSRLAANTPLKRRKYENLVNTSSVKETVFNNERISSNVKDKRKHYVLELSQNSHSEKSNVVTILQNSHIGNSETISDNSFCVPEEGSPKRMKMKKPKDVIKHSVTETVTAMQKADITFETVFIEPTVKKSRPKNLSLTNAIPLDRQNIEESDTFRTLNNKDHDKQTIEATMQEKTAETDPNHEESITNLLSITAISQNTIEASNVKLAKESNITLTIEDPTRLSVKGTDEIANSMNSDSLITLDKIPVRDEIELRVVEKNCNETSREVLNSQLVVNSQNKEVIADSDEPINKSCIEASVYIKEPVLNTQKVTIPSNVSSSTSESEGANVLLGSVENKTIDLETAKVEKIEDLDENINKVNTETEIFIRDSVSNKPEIVEQHQDSFATFDSNQTSVLVLGEDMRVHFVKTNDSEETITTETNTSALAEDINKCCRETRVDIGETVLSTQDGNTSLGVSSLIVNSENISALDLGKSDSEKELRNTETTVPIFKECVTNNFVADSVYETQGGVTNLDESPPTDSSKVTTALLLDGEMRKEYTKTSNSEQTLATETSMSVLEEAINKNCTEPSTKHIGLTNDIDPAPITFREDSDMVPENNEVPPLADISNFTSLTLDTNTVRNFRDVSEFLKENSNINMSISHMPIADNSEYLNESVSINTLKTNMEVDKLLEEYNHSARIIANANLKIPTAMHTPTDGRTPACSSVTFSFTASDSSSSYTNSCSCSTTSTVNSATDLYKNEPTSFKVVQTEAQVVELISSTNTSFQDLSLLDLEHDVIMSNDDLLSEFIPTAIMDTIGATSLEHNYAIKPLEASIKNEYDIQSEDNGNTEELLNNINKETPLQGPSLKVSIPIAFIKRFNEITDNRSKNWYLSEKPSTSKAALEALARRNAQSKTDMVHTFNTSSVSVPKRITESMISESVENKQDIATTDGTVVNQLLAGDSCSSSPSLPLKKRRNISGVLDDEFCNATVMMSDDSDLVTMISQESSSNASNKLSDIATETDENKQIEFNNTTEVETTTEQQTIADNQTINHYTNTNYVVEYHTDISKSTNEAMENRETDFENYTNLVPTMEQQITVQDVPNNVILPKNEDESYSAINEESFNDHKNIVNSNSLETITTEQQITASIADSQYETTDEIVSESERDTENIVSVIDKTGVMNEDGTQETEMHMSENSLTVEKDLDASILGEDQQSLAIQEISPITKNITSESALQEEQNDRSINNTTPIATNFTDAAELGGDQQNTVTCKTETDETVENRQYQEFIEPNDIQVDNKQQIGDHILANLTEKLGDIDVPTIQHALEPNQQDFTLNKDDSKHATTTDLLECSRSIAALEMQEHDMQDLMTIQQIHSKDNELVNFNDRANEVILSGYEDQFLVTVCLNDSDAVSGFDTSNNFFTSKEYAENDFDIGNDVIIRTQEIKEESTEFNSNFNSPKSSPINLTKPLTSNALDLNTPILKQNEFLEFSSDAPHALASTNSTNFHLFTTTMPNNEILTTDLNVNNMTQFTNCELNIDQEEPVDRKSLVELSQMDELSFGEHETLQATQLSTTIEQMEQLEYNNFAQSQMHSALTETCNSETFVGMDSPLKISTNTAVTKPIQTDNLAETHATAIPTIKICSTQQSKEPLERDEIIAMPTILAQTQHLAKPSTLSPILPLIKPTTTTTMNTIYEKSNTMFSFSEIVPETTLSTTASIDNPHTDAEKSLSTLPSQNAMSKLQTQTTPPRGNTTRPRAPARVQIVTPQRKNREIAPKTIEEQKTPNIAFTNTTSFCSSVEFDMHEVASSIPVAYPTTPPPRYANLFQFEKYIENLMNLIDVPGIIDSARNLFVDKQALAEAHAALLAQATQFDDEGNAISEPLLLKYHKDGTISILNDNDECIILTANMSKMVKSLSLALSILQEQQSPVLGIRARIHALLKQLTQPKTALVAPNIINSAVIPTAVVNPTNLVDNSRDNDNNASHGMEYGSAVGAEIRQPAPPPLHITNANLQNLQLYASNWQNIEDSGLITSIPNSNIDALPFATNYEHAVAFNFDEPATIRTSNENTNAQRFENAYHTTLEQLGELNCTEDEQNSVVQWQDDRPANAASPGATHIPSCTDVVYEQNVIGTHENVASASMGDNNDNLHVVMIDHGDDTLIEGYALPSSKAHAINELGSKLITTVSPRGEKSKKTVYQRNDNMQYARTPTHRKSTAHGSPKKLSTKRVEKAPKAQCTISPASLAVTPQRQHTRNTAHTKIRGIPQSNTAVSRSSHTIHYRHVPEPVAANAEHKPSATLHYKQSMPRQQEHHALQVPTHYVTSNTNHLPHISIDNVSNFPVFAQQCPQNSALSGGVGLLHNNNVRYLVTTPHTRTSFTPASTTLSNSNIAAAESQETLEQYPQYQLQALPTYSEHLKINEVQLQSVMKNLTNAECRGETADAAVATRATSTNDLRSFRTARTPNAVPTTDSTSTLVFGNDTETTGEETFITTQQQQHQQHAQQQQIQFVPPTTALIISNIQQKQEAEIESLRQELAKRDTQLQTDLELSKVERNQRMYTTLTPISTVPAKYQHFDEREMQILPQQQRSLTLSTIVSTSPAANAPTSLNIQANASRKRGRPRKYNLSDDMLYATAVQLQKHSAGEAAQKYVKLQESAKIRGNASGRNKLPIQKPTHAKIRQIRPTIDRMPNNNKTQDLTSSQPPAVTKPSPEELRPTFTSSANAFHLIENMVETISAQNIASTAVGQQQQLQQDSIHHLPQAQTTPHEHINAITTLFSSYKITKPPLVSGAAARNAGNNNALTNKTKYKAGPKSMHMSRKTTPTSGMRKNSTNSPHAVSNSQSPTKRNHSTSPVTSLRANSPVIISPETAADPKLNKKCAVIMKENEEVINYKRQQVAFINELLEKQREMQRQRALKRQEFQNILKQKREEGKRLMAEISQIKKQQAEAHEKVLETQVQQPQQSPTILNRKRLLVRERNVTFKTNTKVRSRSTTPNRTNDVETDTERAEKVVDTTSAAIMQSVIGGNFELAAEALPSSDAANSTAAALKDMKSARAQDKKSTTSIRLTAGMANEAANAITNSPKTKVQSTTSISLSKLSAIEHVNSASQLCKTSSDEMCRADTSNKAFETNISAISAQSSKTVQNAEKFRGIEMKGIVSPTTSKASFTEKPKQPSLLSLARTPPYPRCARSMTPTRGVRTTDNLLVDCSLSLSSPTSSRTRLQRAPSLSPSIFMNRNRVEVRRSMQDPTSNTDVSTNITSWLLPESPRSLTKSLKVRLKRLQHLNMNASAPSSPEKETSYRIPKSPTVMPTFSREHDANAAPTIAVALTENPKLFEFQMKNNKHKRVQLLKQQLKKELLAMDEKYMRRAGKKGEIASLQSAKDLACSQAKQTAEGHTSKVARRKPQRRPQHSNKKLRLLEKVRTNEEHTNKIQSAFRVTDSPCDNAATANTARVDVEDGLQCNINQETDKIVGDTLANDKNVVYNNSRQLPMEPSENVASKAFVQHSESTEKQQCFLSEPTISDKHAIGDAGIANSQKEPTTKLTMDIGCSNVSDKKHKRTHKHGAIVTQVVDVTPGRRVNDSLLSDLLLAAVNKPALLNDVQNTNSKLSVTEPTASALQIPDNVNEVPCSEPTVGPTTFVKPDNLSPESANDKTHIEISNEMAVAASGLAMLANKPIITTNTETGNEVQNENVAVTMSKKSSSESFSSGMQCVTEPTTVIGLLNDTQTHTITSIDKPDATIDEAKQRDVQNRNDSVPLPDDNSCITDGEESSSDCLLSQLSKRVHKMSDLESIVDATTVHVIKDATMTLMSFEATPTLPAYLLNGESRDVPTPPAIATPAPTPTADLAAEVEQLKPAPTPPLPESIVEENTPTPMSTEPVIREQSTKSNDSTAETVTVQVNEPAQENVVLLGEAPQQAEQAQITTDAGLDNNDFSPGLAQDQQLEEEVNSPAPASAISTSDHEVSSTQEIVYTSTKRANANTLNNSAGISIPPPIDEEAAMLVQNSQIDTTHHLPESSYYMRKRARKFSDEFTMCENKSENSTKVVLKQRRKTFSSESCLPVQISSNNTTFTKHSNELTNSSAKAGTSNGINNGGQNSGGSSPSTTTEPLTKPVQPRRRNHTQKRNNSQSPLTGRSRAGGSVGELNGSFVYSCSRIQPTTVDMADMERCVVLPASAVVPPVNLGNIAHTYSSNNIAQMKVFVPPEVEMCLDDEDAEKNGNVATTTSKRGRAKSSVSKGSRKQPKLESAEKIKAKKTATNITKPKTVQASHKREKTNSRTKLEEGKTSKASASTKASTRSKNVERASHRKRK